MYFFCSDIESEILVGEAAAHLFSCRVVAGEKLYLTDLLGNLAQVEILDSDKKNKEIKFEISDQKNFEFIGPGKILIQSITDKAYLEKLAEIVALGGISKIILFNSEFSQRQNVNLERLDRILTRSCEQSERVFKPVLEVVELDLNQIIELYKPIVLDQAGIAKENVDKNLLKSPVLVGPEGGWSEEEKQMFLESKLNLVSLGEVIFPAWLAGFSWFV